LFVAGPNEEVTLTTKIVSAVTLVALALAAAACGESSGSGSSGGTVTEAAGSGGGGTTTVSVGSAGSVGDALTDSQGMTLYTSEQEAGGMIACTDSCTAIWVPLTVASGTTRPTAETGVKGKLGTIARPGGAEQVTFDGRPLYTFSQDDGPGATTGDGFKDQFAGQSFTWHAVTPTGVSSSSGGGSTGTTSGGAYGY